MTFTPSVEMYHLAVARLQVSLFNWSLRFRTLRIEGTIAILATGRGASNMPRFSQAARSVAANPRRFEP